LSNINTLVTDVYSLLSTKGWYTESLAKETADEINKRISKQYNEDPGSSLLRLSKMGEWCPRALWYSVHHPELAEPLPPWANFKYSYGHVIEALAIALAKAAGHSVTGEQDEVVVDGIKGHRDCIIDGNLVDVKSCSGFMFQKFKNKTISQDDPFGYLAQLDGYLCGSNTETLLLNKDTAFIWAIDKTLGKMYTYEHRKREQFIYERIAKYKRVVEGKHPPSCECGTTKHGASGNIKLDIKASYSAYKRCCFPNLRTFLYADGPLHLIHIERVPDVPELRH
jgi:hypothetical protein